MWRPPHTSGQVAHAIVRPRKHSPFQIIKACDAQVTYGYDPAMPEADDDEGDGGVEQIEEDA